MQYKSDITEYVEKYLHDMKINNYSQDTISGYEKALQYFEKYLSENDIDRVADVTAEIIKEYNNGLRNHVVEKTGKTYKSSTLGTMLNPIKMFFDWLNKQMVILYDPAKDMEVPPSKKGLPRTILSKEEIKKFIEMPRTDTVTGYRDRTIFELFYATGMRNMELQDLRLKDIDLDAGTVRIKKGKGRKERVLPLTKVAKGFLQEYINNIRPVLNKDSLDNQTLFLNMTGKKFWRRGICQIFSNYAKQSDISKPITPHVIRHSVATQLLENGMDIRYIQELLGHGSLQTTQLYSKVTMKGLRKNYNKYHPKERRVNTKVMDYV
ncbi:tyrosine-type recombinase/integrase [Elusimicrobiota bacterium]